jgi:hypothetical protein
MDGGNDLVGVPGIAGLAAEFHTGLERMFASNPTEGVSVRVQGGLVTDAAVIDEHLAALAEQRAFDGERDPVLTTHKLPGLLSRFWMVECLERVHFPKPVAKASLVDKGWGEGGDERCGINAWIVIN